ncbi:MAG: YitT family protein [Flavobacteriaceae bacterium]|nr:YitT family protein [Flavobacteriaceae bacterium]
MTGIAILITSYFDIPITLLLVVINLPFIFMGYKKIGKTFAVQALLAVLLLAAAMHFIEFPVFTNDKVLIAVFGGFFTGLGIGFVIKAGVL